ncbi:MAG: hypothetical protein IKQ20_01565 [Bacteroidales bacterium]|nr:hypothetical protein [Bacteroidales bacterium]
MESKNTLLKIQNAIQSMPLENILATAKSISKATNIPFLPLVITAIELLIKWRPLANNLLSTGAQTVASIQNAPTNNAKKVSHIMSDNASEMSDEEKAEAEQADIMAMLEQMIEIAAEDGDLSPEEEKLLVGIAQEAGISESVVLAKVKMKCLQKK